MKDWIIAVAVLTMAFLWTQAVAALGVPFWLVIGGLLSVGTAVWLLDLRLRSQSRRPRARQRPLTRFEMANRMRTRDAQLQRRWRR